MKFYSYLFLVFLVVPVLSEEKGRLDREEFDCSNVGSNTVELTVTDVNGNSSTCTATVIVEENIPPSALCQDLTIYLDAQGEASITAQEVDAGGEEAASLRRGGRPPPPTLRGA